MIVMDIWHRSIDVNIWSETIDIYNIQYQALNHTESRKLFLNLKKAVLKLLKYEKKIKKDCHW